MEKKTERKKEKENWIKKDLNQRPIVFIDEQIKLRWVSSIKTLWQSVERIFGLKDELEDKEQIILSG